MLRRWISRLHTPHLTPRPGNARLVRVRALDVRVRPCSTFLHAAAASRSRSSTKSMSSTWCGKSSWPNPWWHCWTSETVSVVVLLAAAKMLVSVLVNMNGRCWPVLLWYGKNGRIVEWLCWLGHKSWGQCQWNWWSRGLRPLQFWYKPPTTTKPPTSSTIISRTVRRIAVMTISRRLTPRMSIILVVVVGASKT